LPRARNGDESKLAPFLREQEQLLRQFQWEDEVNAILRKVYAPDNRPASKFQTGKGTVKKW